MPHPPPDPALPRRVRVPVCTVWTGPDRSRGVDAPALADDPDLAGWLRALDAQDSDPAVGEGRLGLHGRVLTQLLAGEPALVVGEDPAHPGWSRVCAPWQPSRLDPRGYPGWVRTGHLGPADLSGRGGADLGHPDGTSSRATTDHPLLDLARRHLGLPYLWGGTSPAGLDCSGLVHWCHRQLGVVVPRDADDQQEACRAVPIDEAVAGDLYFFTAPGSRGAQHVGVVTRPGAMVHAPETGLGLVEESLSAHRLATLSGAGRFLDPVPPPSGPPGDGRPA